MPSPVAAEPSAAGSSPGDAYFVICVEQLPLTGTLFIHPVASSGAHHGRADDPLVADLRLMLQVITSLVRAL
jgi:hypothetical protein